MKRNVKYLAASLSALFVVCLGFAVVERAEGHGRPEGGKSKSLVSSTFDSCRDPSTTILKRRYKVTQIFSHYGDNDPYGPSRQAPIPRHKHTTYETRYVSVKKGHSEYSTSCNSCEWQWVTYLDKEIGRCAERDWGCNADLEDRSDWCQSERDGTQTPTQKVHYSCKEKYECVDVD